ncbi:unnamed protein product [Parnassius apollo]|uniref:(apollo) hypothetical protein n=1 Tax=Parnassius apollo TaxID=110799 RepID=A0A8S3WPF5_PARAO|nr:unnamed protein product [Parnassius apollo]
MRSKSHDRDNPYYCDIDSGPDSTKDSIRELKEKCTCRGRGFNAELSLIELENRELRMKIRRLEKELADKEAELSVARSRFFSELSSDGPSRRDDVEHYRQAAMQAERLLEAREASHRQQIVRLENQAAQLRAQLAAELRRRQAYVARSGRAARDVQRLRTALGDSLRAVAQSAQYVACDISACAPRSVTRCCSHTGSVVCSVRSAQYVECEDPALDSYTLEHEARKLDNTLTHSLPPLNDSYDSSK